MAVSDAGGEDVRGRNAGINPFGNFFETSAHFKQEAVGGGAFKGACQEAKEREREKEDFPVCRESVFVKDQSIFGKTNT